MPQSSDSLTAPDQELFTFDRSNTATNGTEQLQEESSSREHFDSFQPRADQVHRVQPQPAYMNIEVNPVLSHKTSSQIFSDNWRERSPVKPTRIMTETNSQRGKPHENEFDNVYSGSMMHNTIQSMTALKKPPPNSKKSSRSKGKTLKKGKGARTARNLKNKPAREATEDDSFSMPEMLNNLEFEPESGAVSAREIASHHQR